MIPRTVRELLSERPEFLLALMFSTPSGTEWEPTQSVTVEFGEFETTARVQRARDNRRGLTLLGTKQTIFSAILLHHLIVQRGPEFGDSLVRRAREFAEVAASRSADFYPDAKAGLYPPVQSPEADSSTFFEQFDISSSDLEVAQRITREALEFLEREGLAIDPAFTPEMMILVGLLPMHFSVRTPKGERVYREIRIGAAMWSLEIKRGRKSDRPFTDIDFRFRGVEIVRKAITALATQYLETETSIRRSRGQPVLPRAGKPTVPGDDEG